MVRLRSLLGARPPKAVLPPLGPMPTEARPPKIPLDAPVLDRYRVPAGADPDAAAVVTIFELDSLGKYSVSLPPLDADEQSALTLLRSNLRNSIPLDAAGSAEEVVERYIWETAQKAGILPLAKRARAKLLYFLLKEFAGYWEIDPLVNDDAVEEISVTRYDRPVRVLHRRFSEYVFMETDISYESEARLQAFVRRMAQFGGTTVSMAQPSLEVTIHGASDRRVSATLGDEISRPGSTYAIRKQKEKPFTIVQLAAPEPARPYPVAPPLPPESTFTYGENPAHRTLTALMAAYFWLLLEKTTNVLIGGETSSGKTTLMNAILALMNPKAKVVTAEEVLEINLPGDLH